MEAKICLVTCLLCLGQIGDRTNWQLAPQLERGQEFTYSGYYKEQSLVPGVSFQRDYRFQSRLLVLESLNKSWKVSIWTALQHLPQGFGNAPVKGKKPSRASVHLEIAIVDRHGHIISDNKRDLSVPLDGPPTAEHGSIVPAPAFAVGKQESWHITHANRPPAIWRILGTERVSNTTCVKVQATQESANWTDPNTPGAAWQRVDTVWLAPQAGIAFRVERVIKHRDPARINPTHMTKLRYDLERQWTHPPTQFASHLRDVGQSVKMAREAENYFRDPLKNNTELHVLQKRVRSYIAHQRPHQPYRQVLEQLDYRIGKVRDGDFVPVTASSQKPLIPVITVGSRSPDFLVTDLITKKSLRFNHLHGRPIMMVFYNPQTALGQRTLRMAQSIQLKHGAKIKILGMAVTRDTAYAVQQHKTMRLEFPIADGMGLHQTFSVKETPKIIMFDSEGIIRATLTGWNLQLQEQVSAELQKTLSGADNSEK